MKIECGLCKTRECLEKTGKTTITKNYQGEIIAIEVNNLLSNGNLCIIKDNHKKTTAIEVNGRGIGGCLIREQILSNEDLMSQEVVKFIL